MPRGSKPTRTERKQAEREMNNLLREINRTRRANMPNNKNKTRSKNRSKSRSRGRN